MSFLGARENFAAIASSSSAAILDRLNLYYDDNTAVYTAEDYDLYTAGNIATDLDPRHIEKSLEDAEGTFAYVLYLKNTKEIIIGTDKMGFYPLYYTDDAREFIFGNFIPHIKHRLKKAEPNWDSWDELLNTGDVLGRKTTLKGVSRLRQGEKICFAGDVYSLKNFWGYEGTDFVDPQTYISLNNDLLSEGMEVLSANKMHKVLPLTGGHDSRRLAITASSLGVAVEAITQEAFTRGLLDVDMPVASLVVEKLGIKKHTKLPQPEKTNQCENMVYKDYWCGFESSYHTWAVNIAQKLEKNTLVYDGIIGDYTINNHGLQGIPEYLEGNSDIDKTVSLVVPTEKKYQLKGHLMSAPLEERIRTELEKFPQDCNQITLFKIFNHCRNNISQWYTPFLLKGISVGLPYAYLPFFLQSLSIKEKTRSDALIPEG